MAERTWAGTHTFGAHRILNATSVEQVQDAVRNRQGRVRALGTRHSFNDPDGNTWSVQELPAWSAGAQG